MEKKRVFYGWPLSVVLGILYFCSSGSVLSSAQLINPMMLNDASMMMNATMLGTGFSAFVLVQGLGAPVAGWCGSKLGAKATMVIGGAIILVGALAMALFVSDAIGYIVCFGILLSLGTLMAGQISVQSTVGTWFVKNRGKAMTVTMTIGRLAGFVTPVIVGAVLASGSYQNGWFLLSGMGALIIVLALVFVKNKPSDIGQLPDGGEGAANDTPDRKAEAKPAKVYKNTEEVSYSRAIRSPYFWLIALAGAGGFFGYSLTSSQGVIHFTSLGFDQSVIVGAVALLGLAMMAGNILIGLLSDRIAPIPLTSGALALTTVAIFVAAFVPSIAGMYFYYLAIGFGFGSIATNLPTTVANYFGAFEFPKKLGTTMFVTGTITSFVGAMGGAIFDATGSCVMAYVIIGVIVCLCALCSFLVKIPRKS